MMRSGLFSAAVAVGLVAAAMPARSAELIGGGYYEQKIVGGNAVPTRSLTWSYGTPPASPPDQLSRPPARGAGSQQNVGFSPSEEARKKAARDKSGYRDPAPGKAADWR